MELFSEPLTSFLIRRILIITKIASRDLYADEYIQ